MSRPASLLRALKEERTNVYRLIGLVLYATTNLLTVITLQFHHDGQLRYLQIINLVTGILITATVIYGAFDMTKRSIKYEKVKKEKAEIHSKFIDSQQLLFRIDNQTR